MVRIWDTCMFSGELDMLWFRLRHLEGKVHKHVIAEATRTHRGVLRDLVLRQHMGCCLSEWADRIVIVPVHFPDEVKEPWAREHYQRDSMAAGFTSVQPDDLVLLSDVDEIPSDTALTAEIDGPHALRQRIFHSAVDWEYPEPQLTSVIARVRDLVWPSSLSSVRDHRYGLPVIENAGWHFSWLGTTRERQRKLAERTCHLEMPQEEWKAIEDGATWQRGEHHAPDAQVKAVEVDGTWPEYIRARRCPPHWFRPRS